MFKIQNGMRACAGDLEEITTSPEKDRRCTATRSAAPETKLDALARRKERLQAADMEGQMQCKSQRKQDWFEIQNNTDPKRPMQKSPGNDDGDGAPSPEVKNTGHNVVGSPAPVTRTHLGRRRRRRRLLALGQHTTLSGAGTGRWATRWRPRRRPRPLRFS